MFTSWCRFSRYILLAASTVLAGCIDTENNFGKVWSGAGPQAAANVILPANAPSFSNTYYETPASNGGFRSGEEHLGIDIIAALGTPVIAPANGFVIKAFFDPFYGNNIVIDHGDNEDGIRIHTQYKHLQKQLISVGDTVIRGQQIGTLGRTGVLSGGLLHLHFEVQLEGRLRRMEPVNPNAFWVNGIGMVTCFDEKTVWPDVPFQTTYPVPCVGN